MSDFVNPILISAVLLLTQVSLYEEAAEEIEQHDEVHDLKVEEVAAVAARKDRNDAMYDDDNELHELDDRNERFHFGGDALYCLAFEGTEEVIRVHDHVNR